MTYVEYHDGPEQTEAGRIDWLPGWYAICDDYGWSSGPYRCEASAAQAADRHALAMGRSPGRSWNASSGPASASTWPGR